MSDGKEVTGRGDGVPQPESWEGEPTELYPPDEVRLRMRAAIGSALLRHYGEGGIVASDLADEVARDAYETSGEVKFTNGDVTLEIARGLGTSIRMAPNNHLYPKGQPSVF